MTTPSFLDRARGVLRRKRASGNIGVRQLQDMFDYALRFNASDRGSTELGMRGLGSSITFEPVPREIDLRRAPVAYRQDAIVTQPPHLKWGWNPKFAYVGLVDDRVEYRSGSNGEASWREAPVTDDPERIAAIDRMFAIWYRHLGLPDVLQAPTRQERRAQMRAAVAGEDRLALIRHYLVTGDDEFLVEVLGAQDGTLVWVDHGGEDDDIVRDTEAILRTGALSARFAGDGDAPDLIVTWRGEDIRIGYPAPHADRDTTLVGLNRLLQPDYELRLCIASRGSSTLAFLPLPAEAWRDLERACPDAVDRHFERVTADTPMFGE
jgi:hypothetical protein